MVNGLPDPNLSYDVMTKRPNTVSEALDLIQWHESCRTSQKKRANLRQVVEEESSAEHPGTESVRRVNPKQFVTEERLQNFGKSLEEKITGPITELTKTVEKTNHRMDAFAKLVDKRIDGISRMVNRNNPQKKNEDFTPQKSSSTEIHKTTDSKCFVCQAEGHFARNCPKKKMATREVTELLDEDFKDEFFEYEDQEN